MAQDPLQPQDSGKLKYPGMSMGMNRTTDPAGGSARTIVEDGAKKLTQKDKEKILARARKQFDRALSAESENRKAALDDLKFLSGEAQWPSDVSASRNFDKRPCLTVNAIPTYVNQICNDLRQNRPSIHVSPVGDKGDKQVAKFYRGLIRAIERHSRADVAYDTANWNQVVNGWGYIRLATEFEDEDSFDQTLKIVRVRNPFTVYMDPDALEPDGSDAQYCFISEMVPKEEFEELYGEAAMIPWMQAGIGEKHPNWSEKGAIRVCEYFAVKKKYRDLIGLSNGFVGWEDELHDAVKKDIAAGRIEVVRRRRSYERTVTCYKMTALDILETYKWPGTYIPVVRLVGQEIDIEGKVKLSGIVRNAKDPQRILNYAKTAEVEATMLAPKAPYIMEEGQLEGHEDEWRQANTKNFSVLTYKGTSVSGKPAPPPQRVPVAPIPAGIVNMQQGAAQDLQRVTGIRFDATMNERMNDESGKAIRELRRNGDLSSFHFADNYTRGLRHLGTMMIEVIPHIYDTQRMVTILREDDAEEQVMINPSAPQPHAEMVVDQNKPKLKVFNPKAGKYGVTVTIGPSYATRRIEASESMLAFAKAMPQTAQLVADLIAKNMDWEGADEIARRLAMAVPPHMMMPEQKNMSPQVQAAMAGMTNQIKQLSQELNVAKFQLNDKTGDRAVALEKINKDFEAKLLKIVADLETKMAAIDERGEAAANAQLTSLAQGAARIEADLSRAQQKEAKNG